MKIHTCGKIDDMEKHVLALHNIYNHMGKSAVVFHEVRNWYNWLNNLMH